MSFERKRNIIVFFSFVIITVCNFRNCGAASVDVINGLRDVKINPEKASINDKEPRTKHSTKHKPEDLDGRVILSRNLRTTFDDAKHQTQNAITTAKLAPKPLDMRAPWNVRNTFVAQKSSLDLGGSHHADFKGFEGQSIQGKVYGPSANHNHHSSEWLSMRPLVQCEDELMTLTASGRGYIHLMVDRDIKGNERNLNDAPKHCGYVASKGKDGKITLNLPFKSCHMAVQGGMHRIDVIHTTPHGQTREVHLSCPVSMAASNEDCDLPHEQHLPCGPDPPSREVCLSLGCCYSDEPSSCYYPMDECTTDRHFVFMVPASITDPPLSPGLLASTGDPTCAPQRVTPDYALFKMPLEGCGAHKYEVGQSVIYMVEIIKGIQAVSLNYGTITRDSPLRLLVECRYTPSSMASVGYMVKSPSLGPSIQAHGVFGVQLRIAKDMDYSSYYPQYHRPLQMLLGKPLYLEVRLLNPPDESVVLLVHYCVAYPRSGQAAWVLLYNGCPNPLDPVPQIPFTTLPALNLSQGQTRRFTISTFQFLPSEQAQVDDNEEIYFMCSTEVCSPQDGPCSEGCLGQEWDDRRLRTEDR
uniref:ZP domain-containing protein n=1 Tax=Esox lucius TaxID=8010 RepID=A0AAY5KP67_ESOLU